MPDPQGRFVWYELMTTDPAGAKAFYADVVGWKTEEAPTPGMSYTLLAAGGTNVAGLMQIPPDAAAMGAPPSWLGYVGVADVDAAAAKLQRLGGSVKRAAAEIPNVGRFAVVGDPQGAVFALFASDAVPPEPAARITPGHIGWHELQTSDVEQAFGFYREMFGWRKDEVFDMGQMGPYQIFAVGEAAAGGMMKAPPGVPAPGWSFYFNVGDIDAAAARVKAGGGKLHHGPAEVPGGDWIVQGEDPQGAMFALVGKRS